MQRSFRRKTRRGVLTQRPDHFRLAPVDPRRDLAVSVTKQLLRAPETLRVARALGTYVVLGEALGDRGLFK